MKKRIFKGFWGAFVLLLISFLSSFIPLLRMYNRGFISMIIFTENVVAGDYQSSLNIHIIVMIIFLILEDYISIPDNAIRITKYESISKWWMKKIIHSLPFIIYVAFIHEAICIFFAGIFGNVSLALKHGFGYAILLQVIYISLYLLIVYMTKELLSIFIPKSLSLIITILIYCLSFFIIMYFIPSFSFLYYKSAMVRLICLDQLSLADTIVILFRDAGFAILLYNLYLIIRKKSDYFEK